MMSDFGKNGWILAFFCRVSDLDREFVCILQRSDPLF